MYAAYRLFEGQSEGPMCIARRHGGPIQHADMVAGSHTCHCSSGLGAGVRPRKLLPVRARHAVNHPHSLHIRLLLSKLLRVKETLSRRSQARDTAVPAAACKQSTIMQLLDPTSHVSVMHNNLFALMLHLRRLPILAVCPHRSGHYALAQIGELDRAPQPRHPRHDVRVCQCGALSQP